MPHAETPPLPSQKPERKRQDVVPFMEALGAEKKPKKPKEKKPFDVDNPLKKTAGDTMSIIVDNKIDEDWRIKDINPETGLTKVEKEGETKEVNITDPVLYGVNILREQVPEPEKTKEPIHKPSPSRFARVDIKAPGPQAAEETILTMREIPFKPGQNLKVEGPGGRIETDWLYEAYEEDTGKVVLSKKNKPKFKKVVNVKDLIELNK